MAQVQQHGPDAANCNANDQVNLQLWIVSNPGDKGDLSKAIIAVITPRVHHDGWNADKLNALVGNGAKINVSGWLLFNADAEDGGRSSPYEIHPVMQINVSKDGQWVKLDDYQP